MPIGILQVTLNGAAQPVITSGDIVAKTLIIQNNGSAVARVGDSTVTSAKGYSLAAAGGSLQLANASSGIHLVGIYVIGTSAQVLDVIYDTGF